MSTTIGHRMMDGGAKYHRATGEGVVRHVASALINHLGHKVVDHIAHAVSGKGYKLTGQGGGRKKKVGRPRKHHKKATHHKK